jgi:hypothetical protein
MRMPAKLLRPAREFQSGTGLCRRNGGAPRRSAALRLLAVCALLPFSGARGLKGGNQVLLAVADQIGAAHARERLA